MTSSLTRARRLEGEELDATWPKLHRLNRLWRHTTTVTACAIPVVALEPDDPPTHRGS